MGRVADFSTRRLPGAALDGVTFSLDPLAVNHDDPINDPDSGCTNPGQPGCASGQAYEYDEENRLTTVRRAGAPMSAST